MPARAQASTRIIIATIIERQPRNQALTTCSSVSSRCPSDMIAATTTANNDDATIAFDDGAETVSDENAGADNAATKVGFVSLTLESGYNVQNDTAGIFTAGAGSCDSA